MVPNLSYLLMLAPVLYIKSPKMLPNENAAINVIMFLKLNVKVEVWNKIEELKKETGRGKIEGRVYSIGALSWLVVLISEIVFA